MGSAVAAPSVNQETKKKKYPYYIEKPLEEGRVQKFLEIFAAFLRHSNYKPLLEIYSRASTKCSRCANTCQIYQATGDPKDIPCYRSNILLDIYRRHFTIGGWLRGRILGDPGLQEETIDEMLDTFYHCTGCRRCSLECPMGIDHGLMMRLTRNILSEMDIIPKALLVSVREQLEGKTANTSAIPAPAMMDTCEFLEEELEELTGHPIKFPIDQENVEYVFFPAVSDYLLEPDTLMGNAAVLYAAGDQDNWTIGSQYFDGINYGLFYNDAILGRIVEKEIAETRRLKGKKILIGECGHASRSAKAFAPTFNDGEEIPVISIQEYTLNAIEQGKIELDPDAIGETVTYHDPCNIARSGWLVEQPRKILKSFVKNFVEMEPHGKANYCCGGGGGTVSVDEVYDYRMKVSGKIKADQIRATGAEIVVAPCANCKKQLKELVEFYKIPATVVGLHDLILRALRLPPIDKSSEENNEQKSQEEQILEGSGTHA
ncbi:MAG: (Fe-S)-binding protein [Candidatus Omnitrophica bacterium]|nr:(Fe-S)-binding protein [Candidatus Omnitrophota bacterium]